MSHNNTAICALCGKQRDAHFNLIWCYAKRVFKHGRVIFTAIDTHYFTPVVTVEDANAE